MSIIQEPWCRGCLCWPCAGAPLKPQSAVLDGTSNQTHLTGVYACDVRLKQMLQNALTTPLQGLLPPGEPGHLPGHDGDPAPVPGGLVLERRLGRVSCQYRQ